jgi:hypothetical protein
MRAFNVIIEDFNKKEFIPYDVMPYFEKCYKEAKEKPITLEECTKFIDSKAKYRFWSRCEYEIVLTSFPSGKIKEKIDVYSQIKLNLEVITELFMEDLKIKKK